MLKFCSWLQPQNFFNKESFSDLQNLIIEIGLSEVVYMLLHRHDGTVHNIKIITNFDICYS